MFGYKEAVNASGEVLKTGFWMLVGLVIFAVAAIATIIGLVVYLVFFSGSNAPKAETVPAAIHGTAPVATPVQIRYPNVKGLCFRTPMGDYGTVMAQDNDKLDMSFRGGMRATYLYEQVVHVDCGYLPKG